MPRNTRVRWMLAVLSVVVMTGTPARAQERGGAGQVRGRVLEVGGGPLSGAAVELRLGERVVWTTTTDRAGRFTIGAPTGGAYTLRVELIGYDAVERAVRLEAGRASEVELALQVRPVELEALEVTSATRTSTPVAAIPGAVTVLGRREIERSAAVSQGVGELLGKSVPGLAVGTQSMSNYGQTLRGRSVVVLIDGVPQSTLRNVSRDFTTIDPAMIERVEVLRGATAIYGDGATGGVINIITRRPGVGAPRFRTEVGMTSSLRAPGEGVGGTLAQSVSGHAGALDYIVSGSIAQTGGFYDAEGDLIPPDPHGQGGLADTRSYNVFGKFGFTRGEQRVQLSTNYIGSDQDTEYTADPAVNALPPGAAKARALPGLVEDDRQGTRNLVLSLDYSDSDVLGSRIHGQLYHRDYLTRFRGFDRRRYNRETGEYVSGQVGQSFIDSYKWGGRLEVETPLGLAEGSLLWGADYTFENTSQPIGVMDSALYDQSGGLVFRKVGERIWVPPLEPHNLGLFAQLGWNVSGRLLVRGGVRHERIGMHVDDFITVDDNQVYGGDVSYDPTLFNVGAVFDATESLNVYGNFAQGFSLADIGRILRGAGDGFRVGNNTLEAPKVDHFEVGARVTRSPVQSSLSLFYNRSELGTRLQENEIGMLEVARAPERIYGVEATLELRTGRWGYGAVASWNEGEFYDSGADRYRAFDGYRIQPMKVTAYIEHATEGGWENRLQMLYSGSRDRAYEDRLDATASPQYGEWPIESFTVVDLQSRGRVGPGRLAIGVQNLFNREYFDIVSQLDRSDGNAYYTAARGAMLTVGYSVTY